jgi:4-alpha-glucanotransferase
VYTGTHDHDTIRGWWEALDPPVRCEVEAALENAGIADRDPWWALIRLAFASPAVVAIAQMQDVLGLGSEARMNVPGVVDERNWTWQLRRGSLTADLAARLRAATEEAGRLVSGREPAAPRPARSPSRGGRRT